MNKNSSKDACVNGGKNSVAIKMHIIELITNPAQTCKINHEVIFNHIILHAWGMGNIDCMS